MKIAGKKVDMMRCHITPMLLAKPLQAHKFSELKWDAEINDSENGVVVTMPVDQHLKEQQEWFVPMTNIQALKFCKEKEDEAIIERQKPGPKPKIVT